MPVRYLGDSIVDVGGPPSVIQELGAVLADIEGCNQFFYFHIFSSLTSRLKQDIICKSLGFFLTPWASAWLPLACGRIIADDPHFVNPLPGIFSRFFSQPPAYII